MTLGHSLVKPSDFLRKLVPNTSQTMAAAKKKYFIGMNGLQGWNKESLFQVLSGGAEILVFFDGETKQMEVLLQLFSTGIELVHPPR